MADIYRDYNDIENKLFVLGLAVMDWNISFIERVGKTVYTMSTYVLTGDSGTLVIEGESEAGYLQASIVNDIEGWKLSLDFFPEDDLHGDVVEVFHGPTINSIFDQLKEFLDNRWSPSIDAS